MADRTPSSITAVTVRAGNFLALLARACRGDSVEGLARSPGGVEGPAGADMGAGVRDSWVACGGRRGRSTFVSSSMTSGRTSAVMGP